jgi:hypothetical protein
MKKILIIILITFSLVGNGKEIYVKNKINEITIFDIHYPRRCIPPYNLGSDKLMEFNMDIVGDYISIQKYKIPISKICFHNVYQSENTLAIVNIINDTLTINFNYHEILRSYTTQQLLFAYLKIIHFAISKPEVIKSQQKTFKNITKEPEDYLTITTSYLTTVPNSFLTSIINEEDYLVENFINNLKPKIITDSIFYYQGNYILNNKIILEPNEYLNRIQPFIYIKCYKNKTIFIDNRNNNEKYFTLNNQVYFEKFTSSNPEDKLDKNLIYLKLFNPNNLTNYDDFSFSNLQHLTYNLTTNELKYHSAKNIPKQKQNYIAFVFLLIAAVYGGVYFWPKHKKRDTK